MSASDFVEGMQSVKNTVCIIFTANSMISKEGIRKNWGSHNDLMLFFLNLIKTLWINKYL
jgi:hypothetical protein